MSRLLRKIKKRRKRYFFGKSIKTTNFGNAELIKSQGTKMVAHPSKRQKGEEPKEEDPLRKLRTKTNQ